MYELIVTIVLFAFVGFIGGVMRYGTVEDDKLTNS